MLRTEGNHCLEALQTLANTWLAQCAEGERRSFQNPITARGRCIMVSEAFVSDHPAEPFTLMDFDHPHFGPHTAAIFDGNVVIDFTYRQFILNADVPLIRTLNDYRGWGWETINCYSL